MSGKPGMRHGVLGGADNLEPCGTMAAVRRHYRIDGPGWSCPPCRQAERFTAQDRNANRVNAERTPRASTPPSQ